jgi:hypothetical protein
MPTNTVLHDAETCSSNLRLFYIKHAFVGVMNEQFNTLVVCFGLSS